MSAALAAALRDFLSPRMLGLVLWPLLGSLLLWLVLALLFWHDLVGALQSLAAVPALRNLLGDHVLHWFSEFSVTIALLLVLPPLVQASALLITASIAMPRMLDFVSAQYYPQLQRRGSASLAGSVWNALSATAVYLIVWLLTLPLWLFGAPAVVLPILLNAWLNDRMFRYDALAEHAGADEYRQLSRRLGGSFFGLGVAAALVQMVPLLNLISPVFSGLSFIHLGCAELQRLRQGGQPAVQRS